jgi:transposase
LAHLPETPIEPIVYLNTPRRQFYCQHCQKHFTEKLPFVDLERRYTQRYEEYLYQRAQSTSFEQISRDECLSWDQVQGIFNHQFSVKKKGSSGFEGISKTNEKGRLII